MAKIWLHRGTIYLAHVPNENDVDFVQKLTKAVGTARYHNGHKRWAISLSREAVAGLQELGFSLPPEIRDWQQEQNDLEARRKKANKYKSMVACDVREMLVKAGVRFKRELRDHQIIGVAYAIKLHACALLMDTGTGKTATMAVAMQALVDRLGFKKILVVAPKSILDVGWGADLDEFSWLPWVNISDPPKRDPVLQCDQCGQKFKRHITWSHIRKHCTKLISRVGEEQAKFMVFDKHPRLAPIGADDKRELILKALNDPRHIVFLINPESFKLVLDDLMEQDWDMVVVDESSILKSNKSVITQKMILFGDRVKRRVIMTATPRPNHALDWWGQMAFLDKCLGGNFYLFREKYFYQDYSGYKWIPKDDDVEHRIWDIVSQRSYRVKLEDCVDLPGETTEKMEVELDGQLRKHYDEMLRDMATVVENGTTEDGKVIDTQWRIVQLNKLAQITSGYIFDNDGNATFLAESPKIKATVDMAKRLIEDEDRFVVIWIRFSKTEGKVLQEALFKYGVSTLHGETRNVRASVEAFKSKKNRVMIAHPLSAKFGHTWVHSNVAIFHSYDYSWENFYQAKRRIYRLGQTKPVTYITCLAKNTVDEHILNTVFFKEEASEAIIDDNVFNQILLMRKRRKRGQI